MSTFPRPNPTRVVAPTVLTPQPLSNTVLALRFVQSYPKPPRAIFSLTIQADLLDPLDLLDLHQGGQTPHTSYTSSSTTVLLTVQLQLQHQTAAEYHTHTKW